MASENSILASSAIEPHAAVAELDAAGRERGDNEGERLALRLSLAPLDLADRPPMDF
jgi:hypothetical protein